MACRLDVLVKIVSNVNLGVDIDSRQEQSTTAMTSKCKTHGDAILNW